MVNEHMDKYGRNQRYSWFVSQDLSCNRVVVVVVVVVVVGCSESPLIINV